MTEAEKERAAIVAYLNLMKSELAELGHSSAVFWVIQIRRDIERGEHHKQEKRSDGE